MDRAYSAKAITALAQTCTQMNKNERPELRWLQDKYKHIQNKYHLKTKSETDLFLYRRMYDKLPEKDSGILKIRYWRTGVYSPGNRHQCLLLGKALELTDAERDYLIQGYYDRNLDVYNTAECKDELFQKRQQYMRELMASYLSNIPEEILKHLNIPADERNRFFRHLYFTDAFHYIDSAPEIICNVLPQHITSSRYDSELSRQMRLLGEIPRRTFIRHLLILGMPDITLQTLNERLQFFGYLPLQEDHTMIQGEHLDWLLIQLLLLYEKVLETKDRQASLLWFQKACRTLDSYYLREKQPRMRFMHFKALDMLPR